jgi:pyrroline-5-carboxylate reductase
MTTLLLIGHGKMGGALLSRWAQLRPAGVNHFAIVDPHQAKNSFADTRFFTALEKIPEGFKPDIIVLAVKPQQMDAALPDYVNRFGIKPLYISIAAGKSLSYFANILGADAKVVRAMPNTPALVGAGMTALCANANVGEKEKSAVTTLMDEVGKTAWIEETMMDTATAISGSGPAYVFLFMEALQQAAMASGMDEATATLFVRETVKGSALLAEENNFAALRKNVTSPGGTTEAAIKVLQAGGFEKLIGDAVAAAMKRAKDL